MTLQRQFSIWLMALFAFILLLWILSPILLPFLAGMVLAYFLDPVADWLEGHGLNRLAATALIVVTSILALVLVVLMLVPVLVNQLLHFAGDLPGLIKALVDRINEFAPVSLKAWLERSGFDIQDSVGRVAGSATGWIATVAASIWSGGLALVNVVSLLVVTPVVAFYMLADWDRMVARVDSLLPREHVETIRTIARDIDTALAGFIRGQGTVCLLLALFYAAALSLAGLKFGLAIGVLAGALTFIPYVGALLGGVTALGVALVQFWPDYTSVLIVAGVFALGQFLEGNFLSPKLVGGRVGLHPVWLMFALLAFGYLFGFAGLLLAVPLAAAVGVLVRFAIGQYLKSRLYAGPQRPDVPAPVAVVEMAKQSPAKLKKTSRKA
jgi:predicted PurR-regulated permease PerM